MALFKKLTKKVVEDVKETVKEETHKTTGEIKEEVVSKVKEYLPQIVAFLGGLVLILIAKKPTTVKVKVVVDAKAV